MVSVSRAGFPLFTPFPLYNPFPPIAVPIQPIQPITPPTYQAAVPTQTCICVPIGTCTGTVVPVAGIDGSGIIDIRIVNNVSYCYEN